MNARNVVKDLKKLGSPERAKASAWFFKTGKGEYGEGDVFLGIKVPEQRKVALKYRSLSFPEITKLLKSKIHEHRFVALEILVAQFEKGNPFVKQKVAEFYLKNTKYINNWDLVDTSAPYILGEYWYKRDRKILYTLARSKNMWERRIAVLATFWFIGHGDFKDSLATAKILLQDTHDLIHKAVGWMLREIGKQSEKTELAFLEKHASTMPRTMLRYAIEKFPEAKRKYFLGLKGYKG